MASYVASTDNRFYTALEQQYGTAPQISGENRFPAVSLTTKQQAERLTRRDKTGSRSFAGLPPGTRRNTTYELTTYMTGWGGQAEGPGYGPLFEAALGGSGELFAGGTIASAPDSSTLRFTEPHGLSIGQAVQVGGELRFVTNLGSNNEVQVNVPFGLLPTPGQVAGRTITYRAARTPKSVSLFDYWSPNSAVQRIIVGAAVDKMRIRVNSDFHEFQFSGPAGDLIDSTSFSPGISGLSDYPAEPLSTGFDYSIIPGHLGQAWLGSIPEQFYTISSADILLDNNIDLRNKEFGSALARGIAAGQRNVSVSFSLYSDDSAATKGLYEAARQRSPIAVMFQLGQSAGQLFGVFLNSVAPEVPEFADDEARLRWKFANCRAQGTADEEIVIAFG